MVRWQDAGWMRDGWMRGCGEVECVGWMGGCEDGWEGASEGGRADLRNHPFQYRLLRLAPRIVPSGECRRRRALARHVRHACARLLGEADDLPCACWD